MYLIKSIIALDIEILTNPRLWSSLVLLVPFLLAELPFYLFIIVASVKSMLHMTFKPKSLQSFFPMVSCIVCGYSEGAEIKRSLDSLLTQRYPGPIEVLLIIDGALANKTTYDAAKKYKKTYRNTPQRTLRIIPKHTRGGHASSLNIGMKFARGKYILTLDGDSSCDNDLLSSGMENFKNPDIVAISGAIRVRNAKKNLLTRLQAIEYLLSINLARQGLGYLNILNIISGAFGIYRTKFVRRMQGWKNGSAEDLDMTIRIQAYFQRHQNLKLSHDSKAIIHTDAPETVKGLLKQRLRWDGDTYYIYCRRHWRTLRPKFLGWKLFFMLIWSTLFLQIIMPLTITLFTIYLFLQFSVSYVLSILILIYIYYLLVSLFLYSLYLILISERKTYDLSFMPLLGLMPFYQFIMRVWSGVAIIYEIILKTHKNSTMAPWWVIKKTH